MCKLSHSRLNTLQTLVQVGYMLAGINLGCLHELAVLICDAPYTQPSYSRHHTHHHMVTMWPPACSTYPCRIDACLSTQEDSKDLVLLVVFLIVHSI